MTYAARWERPGRWLHRGSGGGDDSCGVESHNRAEQFFGTENKPGWEEHGGPINDHSIVGQPHSRGDMHLALTFESTGDSILLASTERWDRNRETPVLKQEACRASGVGW